MASDNHPYRPVKPKDSQTLSERVKWAGQAACIGHATEKWFDNPAAPLTQAAITICGRCEVSLDCLSSALEEESGYGNSKRHGVRGGLTPGARESLAKKLRKNHA